MLPEPVHSGSGSAAVLTPMTTQLLLRFSTSLLVAGGICSYGLRRRSLSPSGAAAAFHMGVLHMTCGWTFGLVLICFFATSSKVNDGTCTRAHTAGPTCWPTARSASLLPASAASLSLSTCPAADKVPPGAESKA